MFKILGLLALMVAAYCQDHHHGNTISLKTVVRHEVPKKVEQHNYDDIKEEEPDYDQIVPEISAGLENQYNVVSSQNLFQQQLSKTTERSPDLQVQAQFLVPRIPPSDPAPVYESQEPVRAPVHLKIVQQWDRYAPAQHRVIQLLHQKPIRSKNPKAIRVHPQNPKAPLVIQTVNALVNEKGPRTIVNQPSISPILQQIHVDRHNAEVDYHGPQHPESIIENEDPELNQQTFVQDDSETYYGGSQYKETSQKESRQYQPQHEDYNFNVYPKHNFAYEDNDEQTQGSQHRHEFREGDTVEEVHILQEPNEFTRTSNYGFNKRTGFNVDVIHERHT